MTSLLHSRVDQGRNCPADLTLGEGLGIPRHQERILAYPGRTIQPWGVLKVELENGKK